MTARSALINISVERTPYGDLESEMPDAPVTSIGLHLSGRCTLEWGYDGKTWVGSPGRGHITVVPRGRSGLLRVRGGSCEILKIGIPDAAIIAWAGVANNLGMAIG